MDIPINYKGVIYTILIDDEDYDLIKNYNWRILPDISGNFYAYGYKYLSYKNYHRISMHRLIMNAPDGIEVDHENRNGLDNRRSVNLRLITKSGNQRNSKYKRKCDLPRGIYARYHNNLIYGYVASIRINGKSKYLGIRKSVEEASALYEIANANQIEKEIIK